MPGSTLILQQAEQLGGFLVCMWGIILICNIGAYFRGNRNMYERLNKISNMRRRRYSSFNDIEESTPNLNKTKNEDDGKTKLFEEQGRFDIDTCVICLDKFEDGLDVLVLPCGHEFHKECIEPWLLKKSNDCPICGESILKPENENVNKKKAATINSSNNDSGMKDENRYVELIGREAKTTSSPPEQNENNTNNNATNDVESGIDEGSERDGDMPLDVDDDHFENITYFKGCWCFHTPSVRIVNMMAITFTGVTIFCAIFYWFTN